jgi:hypothetical protein
MADLRQLDELSMTAPDMWMAAPLANELTIVTDWPREMPVRAAHP